MREDISCERRAVEGRGGAYTPIYPDPRTGTYVLHGNCRDGRGDERARKQEMPLRGAVASPVENKCSHQIHRLGENRIGARTDRAAIGSLERVQVPPTR